MATTEEERKTDYPCRFCGEPLRRYGRPSLGYLKCVNPECTDPAKLENPKHWTMQFEDDFQSREDQLEEDRERFWREAF